MNSPLLTSIPPVFSRQDKQGREIGEHYLTRCIASWREAGFRPITVNAEHEDLHPLIRALDVETVRVARDASDLTGRPHVYLQDVLNAARDFDAERVFITNSDIELELPEHLQSRFHRLGPCQAVAAHRLDYNGDKNGGAQSYGGGIDLLGAHRDVLDGLNCGALVFGMPWWDHYLPLMMQGRDARFVATDGLRAWHLAHGGRWIKKHHLYFGAEFLRLLRTAPAKFKQNSDLQQYLAKVADADQGRYGDNVLDRLKSRAIALVPSTRIHKQRMLRQVSQLNETMLTRIVEPSA